MKYNKFRILIGVLTIVFFSYIQITHHADLLKLPLIKMILGFIFGNMLIEGITAFLEKRHEISLFFILVTICIFPSIFLNTHLHIMGLIPTLAIFIVFAVPISIMAMVMHHLEVKNNL